MYKNRLKELRESKCMTQQELANLVDVHVNYISMLENNERTPGFKLAYKLSEVFNMSINEIFYYFDEKNNEMFDESL